MNDLLPPMLLEPVYRSKPWGGRRLETALGRRDLPEGPVGESWEAVDTHEACSRVASGPHAGRTLREVLGRPFPLLLKLIDAREDLSVQVHPDGLGGLPCKEEAWVALTDEGAVATGDVMAAAAQDALPGSGHWLERLDRRALRGASAGATPSLIHVPPGCVHAILAGALIWEVQSPEDVTWRLDDYGREDAAGRGRDLHLDRAADLLRRGPRSLRRLERGGTRLCGEHITVELHPPGRITIDAAHAAFFTRGGRILEVPGDSFEVPPGRTVILPSGVSQIETDGWVFAAGTP